MPKPSRGHVVVHATSRPDGQVDVQVQGPVSVGGFSLGGGDAGSVLKNHTVVGNIPNGGLVTAEIERLQDMDGHIELLLFEGKGTV